MLSSAVLGFVCGVALTVAAAIVWTLPPEADAVTAALPQILPVAAVGGVLGALIAMAARLVAQIVHVAQAARRRIGAPD